MLEKNDNDIVIDLGCGSGLSSKCFKDNNSSFVIGIDASEAMLEANDICDDKILVDLS